MSEGAVFAFGVLIGVTAVCVGVYVGAPGIARRTATRAVSGALGRVGIPDALTATVAPIVGEIAATEVRGALFK